ncbi:hypothetical protein PG984_005094 [Apiospora sp. TS-2023a]
MASYQPPLFDPYKQLRDPPNTPIASPSEFTLFPKLPPELQLMIWEHAASEPHILELNVAKRRYFPYDDGIVLEEVETKCMDDQQSPLLTACHDSRWAFLRVPGTFRSWGGIGASLLGRRGVAWRPTMDLVVLGRTVTKADLEFILGFNQIWHLAMHYDLARGLIGECQTPYHSERYRRQHWWKRLGLCSLRTWEIYAEWIAPDDPSVHASEATRNFMGRLGSTCDSLAGWIEMLDRYASEGLRRNGPHVVWIPPRRGQRSAYTGLFRLFEWVRRNYHSDPHERASVTQLLGRPIFGV